MVERDVVLPALGEDGIWFAADERGLPVVAEDVPGDGDVVAAAGDVDEAIVVVEAVLAVAPELVVVDPDVVGEGGGDGVVVDAVVDLQVADDNVGGFVDLEPEADDFGVLETEDGGVVADFRARGERDGALHVDNLGFMALRKSVSVRDMAEDI